MFVFMCHVYVCVGVCVHLYMCVYTSGILSMTFFFLTAGVCVSVFVFVCAVCACACMCICG